MINRRSFFRSVGTFGTVAGFLGFEKFLKTEEVKRDKNSLPKYGFKLLIWNFLDHEKAPAYDLLNLLNKPNPNQSFLDLVEACLVQLDWTGASFIWMIPNKLGIPVELHSIPTHLMIPQPKLIPDYPDGYYRVQPPYPYNPFSSYPTPSMAVGAPIPAQWVIKIESKCILDGCNYYTDKTQNLKQISEALSQQLATFFGKNIKIEVFENKE
jgi:hypothetical protein